MAMYVCMFIRIKYQRMTHLKYNILEMVVTVKSATDSKIEGRKLTSLASAELKGTCNKWEGDV